MTLCLKVRLSYAVGHVLNDLCASVWFTYTLLFFECGIQITATLAGTVVLLGQIADGLATPLVGYLSDRFSGHNSVPPTVDDSELPHAESSETTLISVAPPRTRWYCRLWPYGRKRWHLCGSIMVIVSFPFLFGPPLIGRSSPVWALMLYYSPLVIIFQIGWAAVQISHLSMINELVSEVSERTMLTSLRYLFTVLSNLLVYLTTFVLLHEGSVKPPDDNSTVAILMAEPTMPSHPESPPIFSSSGEHWLSGKYYEDRFGPNDVPAFQYLGFGIIFIGAITTLLFQFGVRKADLERSTATSFETEAGRVRCHTGQISTAIRQPVEIVVNSWRDWLKIPSFWILGFYYMTVRLIVNVSQLYISYYLSNTLALEKSSVALVPLTIYISSIVAVVVQKPIQDRISRETISIIGVLFVAVFCIMVRLPGDPVVQSRVYIAAGFLGIGCCILLVTALSMVSDLIGSNQDNGAFVYGYMSFTDKLGNGVTVQTLQVLVTTYSMGMFYEFVESYGIGACVIIDLLFLITRLLLRKCNYPRAHRIT